MMIRAFAEGGLVLDRPDFIDARAGSAQRSCAGTSMSMGSCTAVMAAGRRGSLPSRRTMPNSLDGLSSHHKATLNLEWLLGARTSSSEWSCSSPMKV